jgi:8-oxo-dGTP pyrophosphatase MutT (NUDIX family)
MIQRLKQALSRRQKHRIVDTDRVKSAVLVPIYYRDGEYYILFTKRTEKVRDHKGQISFPGGAYEEQDATLLDTALRECYEEIGLAAEAVEVLGELDDMPTQMTYYVISPFVAAIPWPYQFRVDPIEVKEIIEVPISTLLDKDCLRQETDPLNDGRITGSFYYCNNRIIWGATARILNQFLDIWTEVVGDKGDKVI